MNILKIKRLSPTAILPKYQTDDASGLDLHADLSRLSPALLILRPGERALVGCGFALAIEPGYEGQVRSRSGLALKYGVAVLNSPGTIDREFSGEIGALLINRGEENFYITHGDRIAQLVICPVARVVVDEVVDLPPSSRGSGGWGHTGTK